jgi:hypothetical protein
MQEKYVSLHGVDCISSIRKHSPIGSAAYTHTNIFPLEGTDAGKRAVKRSQIILQSQKRLGPLMSQIENIKQWRHKPTKIMYSQNQ